MKTNIAREQALSLFYENEYGFIPNEAKKSCTYKVDEETVKNNIHIRKIIMTYENYDMRTYLYVPNDNTKHKTFVFVLHEYAEKIADKDLVNNYQSLSTYVPVDYIISRGYAVMLVCTSDVVPDEKDSTRPSIIKHLKTEETNYSWGALQAWSWATSKSLDYLLTLKDEIIKDNIIVIGHSRGGKVALLTAAQDERFYMAVSSCSGNSGAALSRDNTGETIKDICTNFPYWFCKNYQQYMDNEDSLPFDQHQLLGLIAPRRVYVSSATEDTWACPKNELESCRKASFIFNENKVSGLLAPSKIETDKSYNEGNIAYHYKTGKHSIEERDWKMYMDYIDNQTKSTS